VRRFLLTLVACLAAFGCGVGDVTEGGVEQSYKEQGAKADALNKSQGQKPMERDPDEPQ